MARVWLTVILLLCSITGLTSASVAGCSPPSIEEVTWYDAVLDNLRPCQGGTVMDVGAEGVKSNVVSIMGMSGATAIATSAIPVGALVLAVKLEATATITEKLAAGHDLVSTAGNPSGNEERPFAIDGWTTAQHIPAGAISAEGCHAPAEKRLTPTKPREWFIENCPNGVNYEMSHLDHE